MPNGQIVSTLFSPAIWLIRLMCLSVRIHDNSRTERATELKFCMNATYINLALVTKVGPKWITRRPPAFLITANATRFGSVAYKYRTCFVML
jgi:hypothetical protein